MPSFLESVHALFDRSATTSLAARTGGDVGRASSGIAVAVPAVVGALADRADDDDGPAALAAMLDDVDPSLLDEVAAAVGGEGDGGIAADEIFGPGRRRVVGGLASSTSIEADQLDPVVAAVAPVALAELARRRVDESLDETALAALLVKERAALPGGVRPTLEEATTVDLPPPVGGIDDDRNRGLGWLWWALGAVVLVLLLAWLLSTFTDPESSADGGSGGTGEPTGSEDAEPIAELVEDGPDERSDDDPDAALRDPVDSLLDGTGISATIVAGVVTLSGTVDDATIPRQVRESIASLDGVTGVVDLVEVINVDDAADRADDDGTADDAGDRDGDGPEAANGTPAVGDTLNGLLDLAPITFATGSARLTDEGLAAVDRVVVFLNQESDVRVEIGGHTDSDGTFAENLVLSSRRAEAVRAYLVDAGIDQRRLEARGYGETSPAVSNDSAEAKAENRRIEFTILG
ncbi:MAG: OmpA family protein [Actinomycetota bacterium]